MVYTYIDFLSVEYIVTVMLLTWKIKIVRGRCKVLLREIICLERRHAAILNYCSKQLAMASFRIKLNF